MKQLFCCALILCALLVCETRFVNAQSSLQFLSSEQHRSRFMDTTPDSVSLWLSEELPHQRQEREWLRREAMLHKDAENWFKTETEDDANFSLQTGPMLSGEVIEAATARLDQPGPSSDDFADMIVDPSGNMYIAGASSAGPGLANDYLTVKYNSVGVMQWRARYSGPGNRNDQPQKLFCDAEGNVYVTGGSEGRDSSSDFATVKYDANGVQQWAARYDGPAHAQDAGRDLAVDAEGNVFVVGRSIGSIIVHSPFDHEYDADFATIKYNANGKEEWVMRHNGAGYDSDDPRALAVDSQGNVFVTGSTFIAASQKDFITIKYNSDGVQQWLEHYNGGGFSNDEAAFIAVDDLDNVYVAGSSRIEATPKTDGAIIKYDRRGIVRWVAKYEHFVLDAFAVDRMQNAYVAGRAMGEGREYFAIAKFNAAGAQQWSKRQILPDYKPRSMRGLALDSAGSIYVAGKISDRVHELFILKYDLHGIKQWQTSFDTRHNTSAYAFGLDADNNVYVAGSRYDRPKKFYVVKLYTRNMLRSYFYHDEPGHSDNRARLLWRDEAGNIYVAGRNSDYSTSRHDAVIAKYDQNLVEQWRARCVGIPKVVDMATDAGGNVYLIGDGPVLQGLRDYLIFKFNATGQRQWQISLRRKRDDYTTALVVDKLGNVYVTGYIHSRVSNRSVGYDYFTVKYSPQGLELWRARYDGAYGNDYAVALAVDEQNNVYVAGHSSTGASYDFVTIKYNDAGKQQWVVKYGEGTTSEYLRALKLDEAGNIYVTGYTISPQNPSDFLTIKYNPTGAEQWAEKYNNPQNTDDVPNALALDNKGNVYVVGSRSKGADYDFSTVKYNSQGVLQWAKQYNGPGNKRVEARALVLDKIGNAYVAGVSLSQFGQHHTTIKYDAAGNQVWLAEHRGASYNGEIANGIAVDPTGNVYVAGSSFSRSTSSDFFTIKYAQPNFVVEKALVKGGAQEEKKEASSDQATVTGYHLAQNYPNPFNPETRIAFELPREGETQLRIYSIAGELVRALANTKLAMGRHEVRWNGRNQRGEPAAGGVYLYALVVKGEKGDVIFTQTRRMIFMR